MSRSRTRSACSHKEDRHWLPGRPPAVDIAFPLGHSSSRKQAFRPQASLAAAVRREGRGALLRSRRRYDARATGNDMRSSTASLKDEGSSSSRRRRVTTKHEGSSPRKRQVTTRRRRGASALVHFDVSTTVDAREHVVRLGDRVTIMRDAQSLQAPSWAGHARQVV